MVDETKNSSTKRERRIEMIQLKVVGADCSNGMKILKNIGKVERELDCEMNVEKISSKEKEKYNIRVVPTLIINDTVVSNGNVLSDREIKNIIKQYLEA